MRANRYRLGWLRENIEQNLSRVDSVLAEIVADSLGETSIEAGEPWVERLFERRRGLQSTLAEIEQQIARYPA
jgi:hypothetical protein